MIHNGPEGMLFYQRETQLEKMILHQIRKNATAWPV